MKSIRRNSKKFLYVANFSDDNALAILKPNIFGISKIVRIDTNYNIAKTTNYFTFNNWFNGYLIVYENVSNGLASFWFDTDLTIVPNTNGLSAPSNIIFNQSILRAMNVHKITTLLKVHPEVLQKLQTMEGGDSYFISTNFCTPFIYTPNGGLFTEKYIN